MLLLIDEVLYKVHWGTQGYKRAKAFKSYRGTTIGLVVFVSINVLLRSFVDGARGAWVSKVFSLMVFRLVVSLVFAPGLF